MGKPLPVVQTLSYDPEIDGVTNGLLQTWGSCREMARLSLKGLTKRGSSFALTYGDLTHWLFQHVYDDHRRGTLPLLKGSPTPEYVAAKLNRLKRIWTEENPVASVDLTQHMELTMMLNHIVMPLYFMHWKKDFAKVSWVGLESEFKVPFSVTRNGITYNTFLRGKRDGVFRMEPGGPPWLFETKTKSHIDELVIQEMMPFESQVNLYLIAIWLEMQEFPGGVRYNVVRRPGLRQKKKETLAQFAARVGEDVQKRPLWYFLRQTMKVDRRELDVYLGELEDRVWEFIHWWKGYGGHWRNSGSCQNKYGLCAYLSYCSRKDLNPYFIRSRVFGELAEETR